jgi:uncharacterized glyoxalase superfamily protein PhnB
MKINSDKIFPVIFFETDMYKNISCIIIWSGNWKDLAAWYEEKLGLKKIEEINHPRDTGRLYEFSPRTCWLWIGKHDKVKGKTKEPFRHMFNIEVDSVSKVFRELKEKGVEFIASPFKAPTFDKWFATFSDPDGNMIQIVGPK